MACGVTVGPYHLRATGSMLAFRCGVCKAPIAGAAMVSDDIDDFFGQRQCIDEAFRPLARWSRRAQTRLAILEVRGKPRSVSYLTEQYRLELMAGAVGALSRYPAMCATAFQSPVQLWSWRIRLARPPGYDLPSRYRLLSGGMVQRVYQATLRALVRHASTFPQVVGVPDSLVFCGDRSTDLTGWRAERLALILLRSAFEQRQVLSWTFEVGGATLRDSVFAAAISGNTILRVACRALVIAAYLGFCRLARHYIADGFLCRTDLCTAPDDLFIHGRAEVAGVEYGLVVLPVHSLPGCPPQWSSHAGGGRSTGHQSQR